MNLEFCTVLPFGLGIVALQWRIGAPLCCYFFSCPNLTLHSTLQLRSRRRRLRNLHTDPSLPTSFLLSSLSPPLGQFSQFYTPPSLPAFLQSPLSAAKYANPAGKGPSYMEPSRPSVPPLRRAGRRPFDRFLAQQIGIHSRPPPF